MTIVGGAGARPNTVMLIGEAPGRDEARLGIPFVGRSGSELDWYLRRYNLDQHRWYRTNVFKIYRDGNPDPTPDDIAEWTPTLLAEIQECRPKVVIAVGRFAAQWFLGDDADMESCHGLPHHAGCFDAGRADRGLRAVIVPVYHPAFGLHNPDAKSVINWDFGEVAKIVDLVLTGRHHRLDFRVDPYAGREDYRDVTGEELADELADVRPDELAIDTEGWPGAEWSVQLSWTEGAARVLRTKQPDFAIGARAIQQCVDAGALTITHDAGTPNGCMYDTQMCRGMGIELGRARGWNTMYGAFVQRLEPKGLKPLLWRWCGMRQDDYLGLVADIGKQKQIEYLMRVAQTASTGRWPKPEARIVRDNNKLMGVKLYKPRAIGPTAMAILKDVWSGKVNKDGKLTDPHDRWMGLDDSVRQMVEHDGEFGQMPVGTLDDVPLAKSIYYAGRDSDGTLRLAHAQWKWFEAHHVELKRQGLPSPLDEFGVIRTGMAVLPIFEEMQRTGMPASRSKFRDLTQHVESRMMELKSHLSHVYFDGRPFNPNSSAQMEVLMRREGLAGVKRTKKTGAVSMAKKSIEHFRHGSQAIDEAITWKELGKVDSTYCLPILRIADEQEVSQIVEPDADPDAFVVRCKLKPVSVATRRLAAEDPSLLNQPIRTELGRRVRACYQTSGDMVLGACDYSGQEMRVAAHVSRDELLCSLFVNGGDPHLEAAVRIFGLPADQIDKFEHRLPAKTANFGILYGLSGMGLQDQFRMNGLNWDVDDCDKLIHEILKDVYPGLSACISRVEKDTRRSGVVHDLYGMPRYLPAVWSHKKSEAAEAARQAFSHLVQSTAQGMMQAAMVWLWPSIRTAQDAGLDIRASLQIHDELVFWYRRGLGDLLAPLVMEAFIEHSGIELIVPIEAEWHEATNWGELK